MVSRMAHKKKLVRKSEFAKLCGVSPALISVHSKNRLKKAIKQNKVDVNHPDAQEYIRSRAGAAGGERTSALAKSTAAAETMLAENPKVERPPAAPSAPKQLKTTVDLVERAIVDMTFDSVSGLLREYSTSKASNLALEICKALNNLAAIPVIEEMIHVNNRRVVADVVDAVERELALS